MGMLLTTTNNIDGAVIEHYLGVVVNNSVIGANFVSDIMASFTDFFGGTSGTYQNKMDKLYNLGLEQLERKARKLRADAIVGIKMDFDEISGQGKSMFMFSISGTAVKVKFNSTTAIEYDTKDDADYVSSELLAVERFKRQWLKSPRPFPDQEKWDWIISYKLQEFAEPLFDIIIEYPNTDNYCDYLRALPEEFVVNFLYGKLDTKPNVATSLIKRLGLFKSDRVLNMLKEGYSPKITELLKVRKPYYTKKDIKEMEQVVTELNNLPDFGEIKEVAGGLLSKSKIKYVCKCGQTCNTEESTNSAFFCSTCLRDAKGRTREDRDAITSFIENVEIIKQLISQQ